MPYNTYLMKPDGNNKMAVGSKVRLATFNCATGAVVYGETVGEIVLMCGKVAMVNFNGKTKKVSVHTIVVV